MLFDKYKNYLNKKNVAFKVAIIYAVLGGLWILSSDWILGRFVENLEQSVEFSIYKGILFILLTSFLIFGLISFYINRINKYVEGRSIVEKEIQRKNVQLQVLNHASRDINSVLEIPEIMRKLVSYAFDLTGATSGGAGMMQNGQMVFTEYNENGRLLPINISFSEYAGVPGHVMSTRKAYLTNDAPNDPYVIQEIQKQLKFYSLLDVPIIDKNGRLAGCFEIHNKPEGFNSGDKELLESLATIAAIALENARILEEYKEIQAALKLSEERFRLALDRAPFPMAISTSGGNILRLNQAWTRITGYAHEEIPTVKHWVEKAYGKDKDKMLEVISSFYQKGQKTQDGEFVINTKYGTSRVWSFNRADLGTLPDGHTLILTMAADLTDIRNAEYKLRRHQEEQLEIFNAVPALIFYKNLKNEFIWVNDTAEKWFSCRKEDLINRPLPEVFPGEGEFYYESDKKVIETQRAVKDVVEQMTMREGKRWIKVDKIPFKDEQGNIKGIIGIASDITSLKETEEELIRAKEKAQEANRLKSEFLAQISHEIRTPINVILSYVSLLKEEMQNSINELTDYSFNAIDNSGRRLIRTIDLILNMSDVQAGRYECLYEELDLEKDVLRHILHEFSSAAESRGLRIRFNRGTAIPKVKVDSYTVGQIFINLVDNAIKYTPKGEIAVSLWGKSGLVFAEVSDTGIGMSEEFMDRLFEPFLQEDTGYTRRFEGNGLGLALVKKYCELNNLEIHVRSSKGKGSAFTVIFRAAS
ncbi:MAG: PAS domain S-box protein [Ignavibacteria bacterium]|jgi:PAS domain S-box-containing protein|nr:PAS domain S-box protein [Ignavibacteria bacterium]MCU7505188.1 PAS domain S-box protein [Ignavibacteria bacterium]MCU7518091.1 PAS domain S-box protein [Ignavibacteria bacterium]